MKIVIAHPSADAGQRWKSQIESRLPDAQVDIWPTAWQQADYAIAWKPSSEFFERLKVEQALFCAGAGVDHLLRLQGLPEQLPIIRVENAGMGLQMVHYCALEALRVYRQDDRYALQQAGKIWNELELDSPASFTIGVFGLGVLGAQVAGALRDLGFTVIGHSRTPRQLDGIECYSGDDQLPAFLARCQMLVLLAPHTAQTENLFDSRHLAMLPQGAWLVNAARGALVVEADLLLAIDSGHLNGATLDVFQTEPLPLAHPFWAHPKIRITPHAAAATLVDETAQQIVSKIQGLERGEPVTGLVDRARGY